MNMANMLALLALCGLWVVCSATTVFVSQSGVDSASCGNQSAPCGTLYQASVLINALNSSLVQVAVLNVVDGQNETEITRRLTAQDTDGFDPCLPVPFTVEIAIEINFDASSITSMSDWYSLSVCPATNTLYANEYLFEGGQTLSLTNLRVDDYSITDDSRYPLIRGAWEYYNAAVTCTDCVFRNIASSVTNADNVLIYARVSLLLYNTQWTDIVASTALFFVQVGVSATTAKLPLYTQGDRHVFIIDCEFTNIQSADNVMYVAPCDAHSNITIRDSTFSGIRSGEALIRTDNFQDEIEISRTSFDIEVGSILFPFHVRPSNFWFNEVTFMTAQTELVEAPLIRLGSENVLTMTNCNIEYTYNVTKGCLLNSVPLNQSNWVPSQDWWLEWSCVNPYLFLYSEGQATLRDVQFEAFLIDFSPADPWSENYEFSSNYGSIGSASLFVNYGELNLENFHLVRSLARYVFRNYDTMNVYGFTTWYDEAQFNPNHPQASSIFTSWGGASILNIDSSHIIGFKRWGALAYSASLYLSNSIFERGPIAIPALYNVIVHVENCTFRTVGGQYNALMLDNSRAAGIYIVRSTKAVFINNEISGFDPYGVMYFYEVLDVEMINNTISVDHTSGFAFDVPADQAFIFPGFSPVTFLGGVATKLIDNVFESSTVDASLHWLLYLGGSGLHGLSGNRFTNAAIKAIGSNVTSSFRPGLVDCRDISVNQCSYGIYGDMNADLQDLVQHIAVTEEIDSIIDVQGSNVALDHVQITVSSAVAALSNDPVTLKAVNSTVLLVDSAVAVGSDISFYADECAIVYNELLRDTDDGDKISKLQFECEDEVENSALGKALESESLQFVDTLSPVSIEVQSVSSAYYPGQLLKIDYTVTDELGNLIDYQASEELVIRLEGDAFLTELTVEPNGECPQCAHGVLINLLQINKHIGDTFTLHASILDNVLLSANTEIVLNITGCPVGYGPDENNASCIHCNNGYYNLWAVSVDECRPCEPDRNSGVDCADGDIMVVRDHWMGFHPGDNETIISALCPSQHCCQDTDGCKYNDAVNHVEGVLCALNRDPATRLCGACLDGYSEAMNSPKCVKCDGNHFEFLLLPIFSCVILTLLVFFCSVDPNNRKSKQATDDNREQNQVSAPKHAPKNMCTAIFTHGYFQFMIRTMVMKNIFYYQQAVAQMLATSTYPVLFTDLSAQFELSVTTTVFDADEAALWCFVDGLGAKGKILVDLLVPALVFTMVTVVFVVSRFVLKRELGFCCSKNKTINFSKAYITTFLILIGKVLDVLFKLMSCQHIGDAYAHYYFGDETCYEASWWLAFISMVIIIAVFSLVFVRLKRMDEVTRQSRSNTLNRFVSRYKPEYWYWEYMLFLRRIVIALFAVSVQNITAKFFFAGILLLFTFVQYKVNPFKVQESNEMESILLCFLVFIQVTRVSPMFNDTAVNVVVSCLIIAPFLLLIYYVRHIYTTKVIGGNIATDSKPALSTVSSAASIGADFSDGDGGPTRLTRVTSDSGRNVDMGMPTASETGGNAPTTTADVNADEEQP